MAKSACKIALLFSLHTFNTALCCVVLVVVLGAKINLSGTAAVVAAAAASATVHSAVKLMQVLLFLLC